MNQIEFIGRVNGKPWVNRACCFEQMDCWGLVALYYRHVLGLELHHMPGYEARSDFVTCYEQEVAAWRQISSPAVGCIAVFYYGNTPEHIGVMIEPTKCLHARRDSGFVRIDNIMPLERAYSKVEYLIHGSI